MFLSLEPDCFRLIANSVGPDEMSNYAVFQLGLHCLP